MVGSWLPLAALAAARPPQPAQPTLADHPIAGGAPAISLDGRWSLRQTPTPNQGLLNATVPGDILTDLQRAGRVPDPYWNVSWQRESFVTAWNTGVWSYSRTFPWTPVGAAAGAAGGKEAATALLVFGGVKMGAMITLNGAWLGNATDEWRRYVFPLNSSQLRPS